jgi:beta-N-acetylhexosaminidase
VGTVLRRYGVTRKLLGWAFAFIIGVNNMALAQAVPLKEKIGQMLLIGFKGAEIQPNDAIVQAILQHHIGGVILFDYDFETKTFTHNIRSVEQVTRLTAQLQEYTRQASVNGYPLLIGLDYEGGKVNRLKENYGFPKTLSAAELAKLSLSDAALYARQMAETLAKVGINLNFAPVVDVDVNPESPVIGKIGRSFSSDPNIVADYAALFAKAYYEHGILCTYKHFPGHGSATGDTHQGFVDVTKTWQVTELEPYKALLLNPHGNELVMTAHVVNYNLDSEGHPATLSKPITTDLLRNKLNFQGTVITDDLQMRAITDNYSTEDAVRLAVNAGADILVFGNQLAKPLNPQDLVDIIYNDVQNGQIAESRIDDAYQHIMKLKELLREKTVASEPATS